ncbi:MAG: radical SAM protein [Nitrospinota bacterium]
MISEKTLHKLAVLGGQSFDDREGPPRAGLPRRFLGSDAPGVFPVVLSQGRVMPLLSTLMTNACSYGCAYCPLRASRDVPRYAFSPEELAGAFMSLRRAGRAEGLFLTSGVPGSGVTGVDRMIAVAELLRGRHGFKGYIHLKMLPRAGAAQLERAAQLATRLSVNLEAATEPGLRALAPEKELGADLLPALRRIGGIARELRAEGRPGGPLEAGVTTQFIVGAGGESDATVLRASHALQREGLLRHAHFSAFVPVAETPMEGLPAQPKLREHRLYQAEHLLREYRFPFEDLPLGGRGDLPLEEDPKLAWARRHPEFFPVELATAVYEALLRVPGVGPAWARRLVEARRKVHLRGFEDLARLGPLRRSAAGWLTLRGKRLGPAPAREVQLPLLMPAERRRSRPSRRDLPPCAFR